MSEYGEYVRGTITLTPVGKKRIKLLHINGPCNIIYLHSEEFVSFYEGVAEGKYILRYTLYKSNTNLTCYKLQYVVEVSIARGIKKVIHTTTNRSINSFTIELPIIDDDDLLDLLFTA